MNFSSQIIQLVKGLVLQGMTKVHVHGFFYLLGDILGVRESCPLASLLFAIYTQPLMSLLDADVDKGWLEELQIECGKWLIHQLFANDIGVFLNGLKDGYVQVNNTIHFF